MSFHIVSIFLSVFMTLVSAQGNINPAAPFPQGYGCSPSAVPACATGCINQWQQSLNNAGCLNGFFGSCALSQPFILEQALACVFLNCPTQMANSALSCLGASPMSQLPKSQPQPQPVQSQPVQPQPAAPPAQTQTVVVNPPVVRTILVPAPEGTTICFTSPDAPPRCNKIGK